MGCLREWCAGVPHRAKRAGGAHKHESQTEADTRQSSEKGYMEAEVY